MSYLKKMCVNQNDPNYTYTGKEVSPMGLGYCPAFEKVGAIKTGRDGTSWMIGIKNGVHVWNRIPTLTPEPRPPTPKFETVEYEDDFESYTDLSNSKKKVEGQFQHDMNKQDLLYFNSEVEEKIGVVKPKLKNTWNKAVQRS